MKVLKVTVDEIPQSCGKCTLMKYVNDNPRCCALPDDVSEIVGNPYDMTYRRSDCPLNAEEDRDGNV